MPIYSSRSYIHDRSKSRVGLNQRRTWTWSWTLVVLVSVVSSVWWWWERRSGGSWRRTWPRKLNYFFNIKICFLPSSSVCSSSEVRNSSHQITPAIQLLTLTRSFYEDSLGINKVTHKIFYLLYLVRFGFNLGPDEALSSRLQSDDLLLYLEGVLAELCTEGKRAAPVGPVITTIVLSALVSLLASSEDSEGQAQRETQLGRIGIGIVDWATETLLTWSFMVMGQLTNMTQFQLYNALRCRRMSRNTLIMSRLGRVDWTITKTI